MTLLGPDGLKPLYDGAPPFLTVNFAVIAGGVLILLIVLLLIARAIGAAARRRREEAEAEAYYDTGDHAEAPDAQPIGGPDIAEPEPVAEPEPAPLAELPPVEPEAPVEPEVPVAPEPEPAPEPVAAPEPPTAPAPPPIAEGEVPGAPPEFVAEPAPEPAQTAPEPEPQPEPDATAPEPAPAPPPARDDLTRMKGVGPRLEEKLNGLGIRSFDQIAALTPEEAAALDAQLGDFQGRLERDRWIEQAGLLASGDTAAYEEKFGKL
jgi:predicted flap endonuclease-1-like 5' DNA nuclease